MRNEILLVFSVLFAIISLPLFSTIAYAGTNNTVLVNPNMSTPTGSGNWTNITVSCTDSCNNSWSGSTLNTTNIRTSGASSSVLQWYQPFAVSSSMANSFNVTLDFASRKKTSASSCNQQNNTIYLDNTTNNVTLYTNTTIASESGFTHYLINIGVANFSSSGTYVIYLESSQGTGSSTNAYCTIEWDDVQFTFTWNYPPQWSNNVSSTPAIYNPNTLSLFNTTWTDDDSNGYNISLFETNISGTPYNYTTFRWPGTNISSFNATYPAGTFYGRFFANDSVNFFNVTSNFTFTIAKNSSASSNLTIQPSITLTYGTQSNATCTENNPEETGNLYRNSSLANSENNTLITLPAGVWNYTCNVTQSSNSNYTFTSNSSILTISKAPTNITLWLNGTQANASYNQNEVANFTTKVNITGLTINLTSNYTGFIQQNGTTSIINYTALSTAGNWWNLTAWTVENQNYSSSSRTYFFNVTSTNQPPFWSQNLTSVPNNSEYMTNRNYGFSINWTDLETSVSKVLFETNLSTLTSTLENVTASNNTPDIFFVNFTDRPAGTYVYKWYANDTEGLFNYTDQLIYTIAKNTTNPVKLFLNGSESDQIFTYPSGSNATALAVYSNSGNLNLFRNETSKTNPELIQLAADLYTYKANITGNQNYSNNDTGVSYTLTINKAPTILHVSVNGSESDSSSTYPSSTNTTAWKDSTLQSLTINLYRNSSLVDSENNTFVTLAAKVWNYTLNTSGNQNYSANSTSRLITINKGIPDVKLFLDDLPSSKSITYPAFSTIKGNSTTTIIPPTFNLYRNNSGPISTGNPASNDTLLGASVYQFEYNTTGNENWTTASNSSLFLTVQQNNTYYMNLTINETESNKQYTYPTGSNATSWYSIYSPPTIQMWKNDTEINNETALLGAGFYTYKINTSGNANYSSYSKNYNLTIQQATPVIAITISPGNTTYPTQTNTTCIVNTNQATINLYRNNSLANSENNTYIRLPSRTWNYTCNNTATQNYTSSSNSSILIISQNTSTSNYVNLTINTTESNKNYAYLSVSNATALHSLTALTSSATMYKNSTPINNETAQLGAGLYMYWWNITGDENYSSTYKQFNLSIDKGTPQVNLTVTPSSPIDYETQTNATCWGSSGLIFNLYRNSVLANSENNSLITLGVGSHDYICNTTGDANYSSGSNSTSGYTVNTKSISIYLALNGTETDKTYIYPQAVNATGWKDSTLNSEGYLSLTRNGSSVSNPELIKLANSTYNYSLTLSATNYTASPITNRYARVNKGNASIFISISPGDTTYPTQTTTTCTRTGGENEITINLYRNGSLANSENNTAIRLGVNTYNYTCNYTTTENYTTNTTSSILIISQNTSTKNFMNITLNNSESNQSFTYPAGSNITANYSSSVFSGETITFNLYNNTSQIGSSNPISDIKQLAANVYQYVYNTSGNTNYSSASKIIVLTLNKANNPVNLLLNGTLNANRIYTYPEAINATGNSSTLQSDITVKLYRNGTLVDSGTPKVEEDILLGNNTYEYKVNSTLGQNYSANDTGTTFYAFVNKGDTESQLFINNSRANKVTNQYRVLNFTVKTNVSGRSVELWTNYSNGVWKKWDGPQTETLFNYTNMTVSGTFNFTANFSGDANYSSDLETWNVTVTEVDVAPPTWSNNNTNPLSPTTYSPSSNYQFNITWSDNIGISDVIFEWNGTTNYTFLDGQISNYSNVYVRNMPDLVAGNHIYKWFAVDGGDNWNQTQSNNYQINKASPSSNLHVAINGSESNQEKIYPNATNTTGFADFSSNQDLVFNLYRDNSFITTGDPASDLILLGGGNYTYIYNTSGGINYSSGSVTRLLNITPSITNYVDLYLNGNKNQDLTIVYGTQSNATAVSVSPNSGFVSLYRNDSLANTENNTFITLGVGTHTYKVNITGNQNYSSNSSGATFNLFISKAPTSISLYLNDSLWSSQANSIYPNASRTNATINVSTLQSSVVLRRNGTIVSNPEEILLGSNIYNYSGESAGNDNYSSSSVQRILNISRGPMDIKLFLDGLESNRSYEQYSTANFTAQSNVSIAITLQSNYSGFSPINNNTVIYNQTILTTVSNFNNLTVNSSGNENYTSSYRTYFFNVTPATSKLIMSLVEPTEGSTKLVREGQSFLMNATITCKVVDCGLVNATARYNLAVINNTGTLFTGDSVVQSCTLNADQSCNVAWNVSTTSLGSWNIDVNASNSVSNNTVDAVLSVYRVITEVVTVTREILGYLQAPLLDLEITNLTPVVFVGDNLFYTINLTNVGYNQTSFDVVIHKRVTDNNTRLLEDAITRSMTSGILITDSMRIPRDFKPGRYFFELYVEYVGRNATAIATFEVKEIPAVEIDLSLLFELIALIIIIFLSVRYGEDAKSALDKSFKKMKRISIPAMPKISLPKAKPEEIEIYESTLLEYKDEIKIEFIRRLRRKLREGGYL